LSERPIAARWRAVRGEQRSALIPYLTAGFPTPALSLAAIQAVARTGADFIEVGIPFSDPLADGPTIQRATQTALEGGMTVAGVLKQIADAGVGVPVIVMTYLNPVLAYGPERFARDAAKAGAAGVLLTDLPSGVDPALEDTIAKTGKLDLIRLVAPTTPPERLAEAGRRGSGFIYLISRLGVTGARAEVPPDLTELVARVRRAASLPIAVGFGIGTADQARAAAEVADGVVVGSALVDALGKEGVAGVERLTRALAAAMRPAEARA